ncbi:cytochrome oxidase putative small subunit CydP [Bordetella sp. LUAb4]|uniref:cytochrome oxidase putative small subunit CydP n=1 Tax=Bordetella sp. LUAb4 TaxID=2843195 RepID=UPI001E5A4614|nr:cytochrome oxidase putative small subunit CydP [Bordetella sp. LUAb4]
MPPLPADPCRKARCCQRARPLGPRRPSFLARAGAFGRAHPTAREIALVVIVKLTLLVLLQLLFFSNPQKNASFGPKQVSAALVGPPTQPSETGHDR